MSNSVRAVQSTQGEWNILSQVRRYSALLFFRSITCDCLPEASSLLLRHRHSKCVCLECRRKRFQLSRVYYQRSEALLAHFERSSKKIFFCVRHSEARKANSGVFTNCISMSSRDRGLSLQSVKIVVTRRIIGGLK